MSRAAAQELAIFAALSPVIASNLAVPVDNNIYATDASNSHGAIVPTKVAEEMSNLLWKTPDRKGGNVPMMIRFQASMKGYLDEEVLQAQSVHYDKEEEWSVPQRPLGLCYDFVEVFGGAGIVTKYLYEMGVICAPILDISYSPHYSIRDERIISWLIFVLETHRIKAILVAPPCTTVSPVAYPPLRTYQQPLGLYLENPVAIEGTMLAHAGLRLMMVSRRTGTIGMLE